MLLFLFLRGLLHFMICVVRIRMCWCESALMGNVLSYPSASQSAYAMHRNASFPTTTLCVVLSENFARVNQGEVVPGGRAFTCCPPTHSTRKCMN